MHGHRYKAELTVRTPGLDKLGMVVDFSFLKEEVGSWIDSRWDHNTILNPLDPLVPYLKRNELRQPYEMPGFHSEDRNPTAENLAHALHDIASSILGDRAEVVSVRIWETPSCCATYPG